MTTEKADSCILDVQFSVIQTLKYYAEFIHHTRMPKFSNLYLK